MSENIAFIDTVDLPFSDHVHRLVTCQSAPRRVEGKETQAGTCAVVDEAVVLLKQAVEVFDLRFQGFHSLGLDGVFVDVNYPQ